MAGMYLVRQGEGQVEFWGLEWGRRGKGEEVDFSVLNIHQFLIPSFQTYLPLFSFRTYAMKLASIHVYTIDRWFKNYGLVPTSGS